MEVERIYVGDDALIAYSSDSLRSNLGILRGTASFTDNPDATRDVITVFIGKLARHYRGDFLDEALTFPAHVVTDDKQHLFEKAFMKFSAEIERATDRAVSERGKFWKAMEQSLTAN